MKQSQDSEIKNYRWECLPFIQTMGNFMRKLQII